MLGETISHYRILDKLGKGGMGEVYLAEDTTLKRKVALKVLPPELASSQERLERFQREAESLASLNHPNIVTIHTVEEDDGVRFLTMEWVEGQTLADLVEKGGLPLEKIFEIATPLADALAVAHSKGIVHRDLKPGNVMVTNEGRVKVLDFGLAKLLEEEPDLVATEMATEALTRDGIAMGTIPYMSPEQVQGKAVDHRSDIFSLGIVLYEMSTGQLPFEGETSADLISSILAGVLYDIDLAFDGDKIIASVGGDPILTMPPWQGKAPSGTVGFHAADTIAVFDVVSVLTVTATAEPSLLFSDGFEGGDLGGWSSHSP